MTHDHRSSSINSIGVAFLLNLSFALLEAVGGFVFNSVMILSDALHDIGDSLSLGVAWLLEKISRKQRDQQFTYGYQRYSLLGAVVNTIVLMGGSLFIIVNSIERLLQPRQPVVPGMIGFAVLGIMVNGAAVWRLHSNQSINAKLVFWHLLEDVLGWVAILLVSILLLFTDWYFLDPLLAIVITGLVMFNVLRNFRKALAVFLQKVPENINNTDVVAHLVHLPKVRGVHHTHVWSLDGEHHVLTTHIVVEEDTSQVEIINIKAQVRRMAQTLNCEHVTVEIERCDSECTMFPDGNKPH